MPELTPGERLQPALLDRLTDDRPEESDESRTTRVISIRQLRAGVQRDLAWLLNTTHLEAGIDLDDLPEVATSVLNYGVPSIAGDVPNKADVAALTDAIRRSVLRYEPRLLPGTLKVTALENKEAKPTGAISFGIEGQLWAQPLPIRVYLKTDIDLDIGSVSVQDLG